MPLLDLSRVTRTLKALIEQNLARPDVGRLTVTVTPQPPERVGSAQNTLSLHLYHVAQEAYYTNTPGPGNDIPNVARNPLALCLYYILTAHHDSADAEMDPFTQQTLMGLAIKTLHDFPMITDDTVVNGGPPLLAAQGLDGGDNHLQIIMRPIAPEEAVSFWSTEEQQTARLSAYYEVRVVMLEPEPPRMLPGIVYALGTYVVSIGSPYFECSRNLLSFELPPSTGLSVPQRIEATPARVSTLPVDPQFPRNRLNLIGNNLTIGKSRALVWKNALWAKQGFDTVTIDPALSPPGWTLEYHSDRIQVDIAPEVSPDGATILTVFPGVYQASLRVVKDEEVTLNHLKQITDSSNDVAFFVAPRIASHDPPESDSRITVTLDGTFDLIYGMGTDEALDIQVIVDGRVYERGFLAVPPATAADNDGRFEVDSTSITFQPVFTVAAPGEYLFRLVINGAESQPFWIVLP